MTVREPRANEKRSASEKPSPKKLAPKRAPEKKSKPKTSPKKSIEPGRATPAPKSASTGRTAATAKAERIPSAGKASAPAAGRPRRRSPRRATTEALATWIPFGDAERPRSSSFIPAPPRAPSPSGTVAPPASSDRILRPGDLEETGIRRNTVRVDVEQESGRTIVSVHPERTTIGPGDGIEWDFHYLLGADVAVERVEIRFRKTSPFAKTSFKSKKPDGGRPHRHVSGPARLSSDGKDFRFTIHCFNLMRTEVARAEATISISSRPAE